MYPIFLILLLMFSPRTPILPPQLPERVDYGREVPDTREVTSYVMAVLCADLTTDQKVEGLQTILPGLPDDPTRMVYEYRMLVAILQGAPIRTFEVKCERAEIAHALFAELPTRYDHALYVRPYGYQRSEPNYPEVMLPEAALHLASSCYFCFEDPERARELLFQGFDLIQQTRRVRSEFLRGLPRPERNSMDEPGNVRSTDYIPYEQRVRNWEAKQARAERGELTNNAEEQLVRTMVMRFGETFGRQRPWEVAGTMRQLLERYPNGPIADAANQHIERAMEVMQISGNFGPGETTLPAAHELADEPPAVLAGTGGAPTTPHTPASTAASAPSTAGGWLWAGLLAGVGVVLVGGLAWLLVPRRRGGARPLASSA